MMLGMMYFHLLLVVISLDLAEMRRLEGNPRRREAKRPVHHHQQVDPWMADISPADAMNKEENDAWRFLLEDESMSLSMSIHEEELPPTQASFTPRPSAAPRPPVVVPSSTPQPSVTEAPIGTEPPTTARCPSVDEPCMNEENFEICTELVESGCQVLLVQESCPLQFACGDSTPTPTACPSVDEPCMNEENFRVCTNLIMDGCRDLLILESCPLQFQCGGKYPSCGGIAGIPCEEGLFCYTGISDECDEDCGAAECLGECRRVLEGEQCLGFAGFQCPDGSECVDEKGDGCSTNCGGADCIGICLTV